MNNLRARVVLDARMIDDRPSGLDRYARKLTAALPLRAPDLDFTVVLRPGVKLSLPNSNVQIAHIPGWLDFPDNWLRGHQINRLGADLYHSLHHFLPLGLAAPHVVFTLHDLIWVEHADLTFDTPLAWVKERLVNLQGWSTMGYAIRRADHVIAISDYTRARALARYPITAARITTVYHGVTVEDFSPLDSVAHDEGIPYFLCLGNSKPYKNLRGVIHAFSKLAPRYPHLELVITGRGDSTPHLRQLAGQLGVLSRLRFTGLVSPAELRRLLIRAQALVFPSFVEGFGFPLLEAMAAECPVVSSDIPVVCEIVGDAALLADPHDPSAIAMRMEELLNSPVRRDMLIRAGKARVRQFTWDRCVDQTLAVYRWLLGARASA